MKTWLRSALCWSFLVVSASSVWGRDPAAPPHLQQALALVDAVKPADTNYQHKDNVVVWPGTPGTTHAECHTDCSGLIDALLKRSYNLTDEQLTTWLKSKRPLAKHYHAAIAEKRGFEPIATVPQILPGDLLAIEYPAGNENTGHMMLIVDKPRRRTASEPLVANTEQWEVTVIDSSHSGHGTTDTRMRADHTSGEGLGRGVLRLYTDANGAVAGYAWSTTKAAKFADQATNNLIIGRVKPDAIPAPKSAR